MARRPLDPPLFDIDGSGAASWVPEIWAKNYAFAAALDAMIPLEGRGAYPETWEKIASDFLHHARYGHYGNPADGVPDAIRYGRLGVTEQEFIALRLMIYG